MKPILTIILYGVSAGLISVGNALTAVMQSGGELNAPALIAAGIGGIIAAAKDWHSLTRPKP